MAGPSSRKQENAYLWLDFALNFHHLFTSHIIDCPLLEWAVSQKNEDKGYISDYID
jgi:hypothetical protein